MVSGHAGSLMEHDTIECYNGSIELPIKYMLIYLNNAIKTSNSLILLPLLDTVILVYLCVLLNLSYVAI